MYSDMIYSGKIPERLFLIFHKDLDNLHSFTDNKKVAKQLIKERGDSYYYSEVKKTDIPKVMEYLKNSNTMADELDYYSLISGDVKNVMTYPEYEMFYEQFSLFMCQTDMAIEKLDELLPFIRLTKKEEEVLREFYAVVFDIDGDGHGYDHPSEIDYNEERAISYYVKFL